MSAQGNIDKVDSAPVDPDFDDLLRQWRRSIELELRVAAPARVIAYNPTTQRADVTIEFLPVAIAADGDTEIPQPPIIVPGCPVRWSGGSLGYVTTPLVPGDTGHVVFTDRCLSTWLAQGAPVDPLSGRSHDLADAIFEPGIRASNNAIAPATDLAATVVEGPLVKLGRNANEATGQIAMAQLLHTYLTQMVASLVPVALDGGAALKAGMTAWLLANPFTSFASTKARAE